MSDDSTEPKPTTLDEEIRQLASDDDASVFDDAATEEIHSETFTISSYGADYTVDGLVKRMTNGSFYVPSFQRSYVWSQRQASRFIESLLMGLPVPGIFVFKEPDSAKHLIVDGQQRLKSLHYFYEGTFRERKFRLLDVNDHWNDTTYGDLDEDDGSTMPSFTRRSSSRTNRRMASGVFMKYSRELIQGGSSCQPRRYGCA